MELSSFSQFVFEAIEVDFSEHILTLTLNRPDKKNAINPVMANELIYALQTATNERAIRVVVLAAKGDIFCAGGDLKAMHGQKQDTRSTVPIRGEIQDISLVLRNLHKPLIIKAQGSVLAGALLFTCNATHVIASDHIHFSAPEIKRGLWPYMVMAGLFKIMPRRQALDFIMRGYKMDVKKAKELGLINDYVSSDQLDNAVNTIATEMANLAPETMKNGLKAFYAQENMAFEEAIPYLNTMLQKTIKSKDAKEGMMAFIEKREPNWD